MIITVTAMGKASIKLALDNRMNNKKRSWWIFYHYTCISSYPIIILARRAETYFQAYLISRRRRSCRIKFICSRVFIQVTWNFRTMFLLIKNSNETERHKSETIKVHVCWENCTCNVYHCTNNNRFLHMYKVWILYSGKISNVIIFIYFKGLTRV